MWTYTGPVVSEFGKATQLIARGHKAAAKTSFLMFSMKCMGLNKTISYLITSSQGTATRLRAGRPGFNSPQGKFWNFLLFAATFQTTSGGHVNSYIMGTGGSYRTQKEVTTHLHVVSMLRIRGDIPTFPSTYA